MNIKVIITTLANILEVSSILNEAADWLNDKGMPLWYNDELTVENLKDDVDNGFYYFIKGWSKIINS